MIDFQCNGCGKHFSVADSFAGRSAKCKACGATIVVPMTKANDTATPTTSAPSLRTRRLNAEAEQMRRAFADSDSIGIESISGDPPERYRLRYRVAGLERADDAAEPTVREEHCVEIECGPEYPRLSPRCRILTPIFHPNFDAVNICIGDHWTAGERLVDLAVRIAEMIGYQAYNIKSPLDGEAAMWADLNAEKLPIDKRDFHAAIDAASQM